MKTCSVCTIQYSRTREEKSLKKSTQISGCGHVFRQDVISHAGGIEKCWRNHNMADRQDGYGSEAVTTAVRVWFVL